MPVRKLPITIAGMSVKTSYDDNGKKLVTSHLHFKTEPGLESNEVNIWAPANGTCVVRLVPVKKTFDPLAALKEAAALGKKVWDEVQLAFLKKEIEHKEALAKIESERGSRKRGRKSNAQKAAEAAAAAAEVKATKGKKKAKPSVAPKAPATPVVPAPETAMAKLKDILGSREAAETKETEKA